MRGGGFEHAHDVNPTIRATRNVGFTSVVSFSYSAVWLSPKSSDSVIDPAIAAGTSRVEAIRAEKILAIEVTGIRGS